MEALLHRSPSRERKPPQERLCHSTDRLGEAHAALGDNLFSYHWDWAGAEREFRRAIQLNPGYAPAHHWYSELLSVLGRHNEALAEIEQARKLDPLSLAINQTVAGAL